MASAEVSEDMGDEFTTKLIHFHEVTQIEDLERCRNILEEHDWNVERAVQSTFNDSSASSSQAVQAQPSDVPLPNVESRTSFRPPSPPHSLLYHQNVIPRQMVYVGGRPHRPPEGVFGWGYFLFVLPIQYTFSQVYNVLRFVFRLFFPDPRERITNPRGDVTSFIEEFEEKFPNHPEFFRDTYGKAQEEAKKQIRFLLVYLHDAGNRDTEPFCHGALTHPDVIAFINRNAIFWACSIDKPEGYRVSKIIRSPRFPSLVVVCQYENRMTVIGRLEGRVTAEELIFRLSEIINTYEPVLISARADKDARSQNLLIRQEQDEAYLISLQQDQAKMDKKKKEEEEEKRIQEKKEQLKMEKELKLKLCLDRKSRCKQEITAEPDAAATNVMNLMIKLPNGTRLRRKFQASNTVKALHDFIYAQDDAPLRFQVFGNFPRRAIPGCCTDIIYNEEQETVLLESTGLGRNDTLFVQALHSDSDDEEDTDDDSGNGDSSR